MKKIQKKSSSQNSKLKRLKIFLILFKMQRKFRQKRMRLWRKAPLHLLNKSRMLKVNSLRTRCGKHATQKIQAAKPSIRARKSWKRSQKQRIQYFKKMQMKQQQRKMLESGANLRSKKYRKSTKRLQSLNLRKNKTGDKKRLTIPRLRKIKMGTKMRLLKTQSKIKMKRMILKIALIEFVYRKMKFLMKTQKKAMILMMRKKRILKKTPKKMIKMSPTRSQII